MALRHVVSTLTLEQATTIATRAIEAGRRERMLPLAVVVVDGGGQIVTLQRDDGCGTLRVRIAQGKARGVLILDGEGRAVGAVGISGDTSDRDEYCAIEGIKAAGLGCDPPEPAPGWRESGL